jgi:deaminated glutathione amidase
MVTTKFIAAAAQVCAGADPETNLQACARLAARAAAAGAKLLVLPECFAFLGLHERDKLAVAEVLDGEKPGPILRAVQDMARREGLWVIAGGMHEVAQRDPDSGAVTKTYISCPVVSPTGALTTVYRKIHLFDVNIPGQAVYRESDTNAPGRDLVVAETPLAPIGLSVCYDLRFPELYRELTLKRGARVLVVPAAFTVPTGEAHWHVLLRTRAIENQCIVIAAAQSGRHNEKRASFGHSMIIDPWGRILDELPEGEGLVMSEIDLEEQDKTRRQLAVLEHATLLSRHTP